MRAAIAVAARSFERIGLSAWNFGRDPPHRRGAPGPDTRVEAYPALVDEGDSVALRVLTTRADQVRAMVAGTRRLLLLGTASPARAVQRLLPNDTKLVLARSPYGGAAELLGDCITAAVDQLMADHGGPAWDEEGFARLLAGVEAGVVDTAVYVATVAGGILVVAGGLEERLDATRAAPFLPAVTDMRRQLAGLVFPGFAGAAGVQPAGRRAALPRSHGTPAGQAGPGDPARSGADGPGPAAGSGVRGPVRCPAPVRRGGGRRLDARGAPGQPLGPDAGHRPPRQ